MDCHLGEHLAVHPDTGCLEAVHKCGVVHSVGFAACADTGDPELSEFAFLLFAADIRIAAGFHHLLICHLEMAGLVAPVSLRET